MHMLSLGCSGAASGRMASSASSLPTYAHRFAHHDSSLSLLSRRGSEAGSRYFQVEDAGVYLSSIAVTVLASSIAILGILLISLVVALWLMLGSCESKPFSSLQASDSTASYCHTFVSNAEVNNLQRWSLPSQCQEFVATYMESGQYLSDVAGATEAARSYLNGLDIQPDGLDIVVLDIDETALSNLPYYQEHHYGAEPYVEKIWNIWVDEARATAIGPTLQLYNELLAANWGIVFITGRTESQRNVTTQNLIAAGYEGWTSLVLRSDAEHGLNALEYKSQRRLSLQSKGFRIRSGLGDQWTDITGVAAGNRTFKLPNPMYYVA